MRLSRSSAEDCEAHEESARKEFIRAALKLGGMIPDKLRVTSEQLKTYLEQELASAVTVISLDWNNAVVGYLVTVRYRNTINSLMIQNGCNDTEAVTVGREYTVIVGEADSNVLELSQAKGL